MASRLSAFALEAQLRDVQPSRAARMSDHRKESCGHQGRTSALIWKKNDSGYLSFDLGMTTISKRVNEKVKIRRNKSHSI